MRGKAEREREGGWGEIERRGGERGIERANKREIYVYRSIETKRGRMEGVEI